MAGPNGTGGNHVGQIQGIQQRPSDVFHAVAGQAAQPSFHGVDGFDAGGKAEGVDFFFRLPRHFLQVLAVIVHQHDDTGVVTLADQAGFGFGQRIFCIIHHHQRILVDGAAVGIEYLIEKTADFLPPFFAEFL